MKKYFRLLLIIAAIMCSMSSCESWKQVSYFQDSDSVNNVSVPLPSQMTVRPGDKIMIVVKCEDNETSDLFNLAYSPRQIGNSGRATSSASQGLLGYTIDAKGRIDFPTLGKIAVAGKTRSEIAAMIKSELAQQGQAMNAVVTVEFMDLSISVLGEVARPARYSVDRDVVTILDAIGMAGDLTIDGQRKNILVMRQENGVQKVYTLNLCDTRSLLSSPAYYLQQNDIVYVQPNSKKARNSTVNGNNVISASFWLSLASTTVTVLTFIFALSRK